MYSDLMGGICAKPYVIGDVLGSSSSWEKVPSKISSESLSKRGESCRAKNRVEVIRNGSDKRLNSSRFDHYEKKKEEFIAYNTPKAIQGELIVAGWPSWLAAVAGEVINGRLPRRADTFEKLDKILKEKRYLLLLSREGGFNYASTDLAAL